MQQEQLAHSFQNETQKVWGTFILNERDSFNFNNLRKYKYWCILDTSEKWSTLLYQQIQTLLQYLTKYSIKNISICVVCIALHLFQLQINWITQNSLSVDIQWGTNCKLYKVKK
jgi:hypothetical protein